MTIPELNSTIDSLEAGHRLSAYEKELLHLAYHMRAIFVSYRVGNTTMFDETLDDANQAFYKERTER